MDSELTPPTGHHLPVSPSRAPDPGAGPGADPDDRALDDTDPNIMPPLAADPPGAVPPPGYSGQTQRARPAQQTHPALRRQPPRPDIPAGQGHPAAAGPGPPAPPRRRRRGLITGIVASAVVVAAVAGGAIVLLRPAVPAATMARQAGQAIASAAGLTLSGTIAGGPARLTVTRAGTVEGGYAQGVSQVSRITIQGVTYLKAPIAFWRSTTVGAAAARQAAGTWARAPAAAAGMSFSAFTPARVARVLERGGRDASVVSASLDGTKVIRLFTAGASYDIAAASPYRLLRIEGVSGTRAYSFDVTALDAAAMAPVFAILHADARALGGAVDPQALVLPLEKIRFGPDCNGAASCTVSSRAKVTAPGSAAIAITMTVDFSATQNGAPFAACTATTATTPAGTVSQTCRVGGRIWSGWFDSHTGNFTTWADAHFEVTVNSPADIAALQDELEAEQHGHQGAPAS